MSSVIRKPQPKKYKPSVEGYKARNAALAAERGVEKAFMAARTVTEAKKILSGKR